MMIYVKAPVGTPTTEQAFIQEFFGGKTDGYFVDIGAFDGLCYSNTHGLWERGWSGLLVEPDPQQFVRLSETYKDQPRVKLLNAAVCLRSGPVDFYQHADPERCGWHSMDRDWVSTWEQGNVRTIHVTGVKFKDLPLASPIDFLSVDAEGMDAVIVRSMPNGWRPSLIMCEVDKRDVREQLDAEMEKRGYEFVWGNYLNSAYRNSAYRYAL